MGLFKMLFWDTKSGYFYTTYTVILVVVIYLLGGELIPSPWALYLLAVITDEVKTDD